MEKTNQLIIDGNPVEVIPGDTILEVAKAAGIDIPVLCYFAHTTANGLCRLCVVEVEGNKMLQAACVAKAQTGSVVHTKSEAVMRARKTILEMLASTVNLSESPELENMLADHGGNPDRFSNGKKRFSPVKEDNPVFIRDYSQCVLCWRCVQVCGEEAQYAHAINFSGRGFNTQVSTGFSKPLPITTCVFCGQCVGVCPTGALKAKREALFEEGLEPEKVYELSKIEGRGKPSRRGPHLDRKNGGTHASS